MSTNESLANPQQIREAVKKDYTRVVEQSSGCCGSAPNHPEETARRIGYSDDEIQAAPDGTNLGVGCGNPTALAALGSGEVVVDLGSGAGFDALLAARAVGPTGRVIGVDMTDAMLEKAGFRDVQIVREANASGAYTSDGSASCDCGGQAATETDEFQEFLENVTSIQVEAVK